MGPTEPQPIGVTTPTVPATSEVSAGVIPGAGTQPAQAEAPQPLIINNKDIIASPDTTPSPPVVGALTTETPPPTAQVTTTPDGSMPSILNPEVDAPPPPAFPDTSASPAQSAPAAEVTPGSEATPDAAAAAYAALPVDTNTPAFPDPSVVTPDATVTIPQTEFPASVVQATPASTPDGSAPLSKEESIARAWGTPATPAPDSAVAGANTSVTAEPQPPITTEAAKSETPVNPTLVSLEQKLANEWKDLSLTDLTIAFNSFVLEVRSREKNLDRITEEGMIEFYKSYMEQKTGIKPETDKEKRWD